MMTLLVKDSRKKKWAVFEFGRRGACEAVVRISKTTRDHKGSLSSGDALDWEK